MSKLYSLAMMVSAWEKGYGEIRSGAVTKHDRVLIGRELAQEFGLPQNRPRVLKTGKFRTRK